MTPRQNSGISWPAISAIGGGLLILAVPVASGLWSMNAKLASMDSTLKSVAEQYAADRQDHKEFREAIMAHGQQLESHEVRLGHLEERK